MIGFILKSYLFIISSYYINKYFFRPKKHEDIHDKYDISEFDKKADKTFVLTELEKKANKEDFYTIDENGNFKIIPNNKNVMMAKNSEEINIGNDSYFGTQNIRIGLISVSKLGLNLSKQPKLFFKKKKICVSLRRINCIFVTHLKGKRWWFQI